jgi:hypothetical protein
MKLPKVITSRRPLHGSRIRGTADEACKRPNRARTSCSNSMHPGCARVSVFKPQALRCDIAGAMEVDPQPEPGRGALARRVF